MMRKTIITMAVATVAALAMLVPAGLANADDGPDGRDRPDRQRHGQCDPRGRYELELDREDGRIEVDYEVTSRRAGQRWVITMKHDGVRFFHGSKVTRLDDDDRPDLEIDRKVANHSGRDRFRVRAVQPATGAVCRVSLSI